MGRKGRAPQHDEEIRLLLEEGKNNKEIAEALNISKCTVTDAKKRMGIKLCKGKASEDEVAEMVRLKQPEWEYVDGYTGSDGRMNIRHKVCGMVTDASSITVRQVKTVRCKYCEEKRRTELKQEQSRIQKIVREFNRPVKKKQQMQMKTCPDCGAFYFSTKSACKDCTVARQKRYNNRKKELKRTKAYTPETKLISARLLYQREGGVCWICGGMCDINADINSDYYPSVDHIVPRSLGGKDTLDNVRLAHRICNTLRSNNTNIVEVRKSLIPQGVVKNF